MRILKISLFMLVVMLISTCTVAFASPKVTADKTTFDILTGTYKLDGNVRVETNRFTVTADHAQVNLSSFEVWAQNNINCVYNQDGTAPMNFSGDDLYGSWNDKTITVKGGTEFKTGSLVIKADKTSFNWDTKIADFTSNVVVTQDGKTKTYDQVKYNVAENKFLDNNAAN